MQPSGAQNELQRGEVEEVEEAGRGGGGAEGGGLMMLSISSEEDLLIHTCITHLNKCSYNHTCNTQ